MPNHRMEHFTLEMNLSCDRARPINKTIIADGRKNLIEEFRYAVLDYYETHIRPSANFNPPSMTFQFLARSTTPREVMMYK